jgi:competence protein ComEA
MKTESVKSFFYFSKGERRGILLLVFLVLLTIISPRIAGMLLKYDEEVSPELSKEVTAFLNEMADTSKPNDNEDTYQQHFQTLPAGNISRAEPDRFEKGNSYNKYQNNKSLPINPMELNKVDSLALLKINGVGPSFAHRILKYRERLGGYVRTDQLLEIYGMTREKYDLLKPFFLVDPSLIKKVDLNNASFKDLMRHPYSSFELAKAICKFRTQYGRIDQVDDILKAGVIADTSFRKLQPYLAAK